MMNKTQSLKHFVYLVGLHIYYVGRCTSNSIRLFAHVNYLYRFPLLSADLITLSQMHYTTSDGRTTLNSEMRGAVERIKPSFSVDTLQ